MRALACIALAAVLAAEAGPAFLDDYPPKDTLEASLIRGEIAFRNYCALCHGTNADGRGRAARLYEPRPANLRLGTRAREYQEAIIRRGGKALGRSAYMPPWGDELTDEQVADILNYLRSISPAGARGPS